MPSMTGASGLNTGLLAKLGAGPRVGQDLARTSAALGRGANQGKKLNAAPWSGTWPAPGATLDLDFANDQGFVRGVGQGRSMDAVTFTRASNGTFVGPDGLLKTNANQGALGKNTVTFPQDFDNAAWSKSNLTVLANAVIAPDGTNTADKLVNNSGQSNGSVVGGTAGNILAPAKNIVAIFDISTGSFVQNVAGAFDSYSITSLASGWYRIAVVLDGVTASAYFKAGEWNRVSIQGYFGNLYIYPKDSSATNGDGASGIYVWGAQVEVGSTATEYFPTNINTPRFDWASTAQVATNTLPLSDSFGAFSSTNLTVTTGQTDPNSGTNAVKIAANSTLGQHIYFWNGGLGPHTVSVYIKADGSNSVRIEWTGVFIGANFNLSNGTTNNSADSAIQDIGSGWYRCSVFARAHTSGQQLRIFPDAITGNYSGNGTDGIILAFPQVEIGIVNPPSPYLSSGAYVATNTPLAANPTSNGLLIEEARTNRLLWNRDATDAAWVKTDVTAAKDQTGIDGVANAASSLTSTADGGTCIQTITLASGSRTGSVFLKRITGTGNVQVSLDGSTWSPVDLSDTEWRRIVLSGTVTNPTVGIRLAVSGDAVAMDYGQVEDGLFATSPILTTTASVTRSADVATMSDSNFVTWWGGREQTIYSEIISYSNTFSGDRYGISFFNRDYFTIGILHDYRNIQNTGGLLDVYTPNLSRAVISNIVSTTRKSFSSIKQGSQHYSLNGNLSSTVSPVSQVISDRVTFSGRGNSAGNQSSAIKRFVFIPRYFSETVGVEMTK
jgi:hypothetical protein